MPKHNVMDCICRHSSWIAGSSPAKTNEGPVRYAEMAASSDGHALSRVCRNPRNKAIFPTAWLWMTGADGAAPCSGGTESRMLPATRRGQSPLVRYEERLMSAVEKEQPEAAKTRFAKDQLKAFVERIERLEEEKKTISDDIRDVYAESKGNGFDVKALRAVIRLRKQDAQERQEHELILDTYLNALGMLAA